MEFIDFFLEKAGISSLDQKAVLKLQITLNSLSLVFTKIAPNLPEEERTLIKEFLSRPSDETGQKVQPLLQRPENQSVVADASLEVMKDLIDDPRFLPSEQREQLLSDLEAWLLNKQQASI